MIKIVKIYLQKLTRQKQDAFITFCKEHPNIIANEDVLGGDDFEIEAQVESLDMLRAVVDEIKSKFSEIIHDYIIHHIFHRHKNEFPKF